MKLHIGCGTVYLNGFINIDSSPDYLVHECPQDLLDENTTEYEQYYKQDFCTLSGHVVADISHNIMEPLPFINESINTVVMYQVLEHIPNYEVDKLIAEIARVLIKGGEFRVSVPDLKETAKLLVNALTKEEEDWAIRLIHGTQKNKWSHHFCGYLPRTLQTLLEKHGFNKFENLPKINFYPVIHLKAIKG